MAPDQSTPRDWDKELAKVDRLIAGGSGGEAPAPARSGAGVSAPPPAGAGAGGFFTWLRLLLALGLGGAMTQWPYLHGCGLPLFAYLGGVVTLVVASVWSMLSSWRSRSAVAHFLSIALLLWGAALAARELLPRLGYARQAAVWICPQTPPAP